MTNNEIQVFTFEKNQVRTIMIDNEPWFVAKDVCEVLQLSKYRDAISKLDDNERMHAQLDTLGGPQNMAIINESGLYKLILRSNKPETRPFKNWVTSEVLPAIRKHGGYMIAKEGESVEEMTMRALIIANEAIQRLTARIENKKIKDS